MKDMASKVVSNWDVGIELCKALGLDPRMTRDIFISIKINDAVRIKVNGYVSEDKLKEIMPILTRYQLVKENNDPDKTK